MPTNHSALGWKIAIGLIMVGQAVLTTVGFRTLDKIDTLATAKAENVVMVNSVILPTLARHDSAIEQLKSKAGVVSK
jgi:hypothetical protein